MSRFNIEWLPQLKGYTVEWADNEGYLLSRKNNIFFSQQLDDPNIFKLIGTLSACRGERLISKNRIGQRLLRFLFYNVLRLSRSGRVFVTFRDRFGLFETDGRFQEVSGLVKPCKFLRGSCAVDEYGGVYLGEYHRNPLRGPMRIYYLPHGAIQLEIVHEFPAGLVRHVHGVYYDPYGQQLWCTTGDLDGECNILTTVDAFHTVDVVGKGDESWRAVGLTFTPEAIYYGTDAEFRQNVIYRIDRKTGKRESLGQVPGPIYYVRALGESQIFGVTAEGCPSQTRNAASLWQVTNDSLHQLFIFDKDWLPIQFMPGTLHFNLGQGYHPDEAFCFFHGLKGVDQLSVRLFSES